MFANFNPFIRRLRICNDVINLNLFELKIANDDEASDDDRRTVNIKNQATAVIDMNTEQFNRDEKICDE